MAKVKRIVVHCTDEPSNAVRDKEYYRHFFFNIKGWNHFGYHLIVYQDGTWGKLQPMPKSDPGDRFITNETMAYGASGFNIDSLHVAYVGGINPVTGHHEDTRTAEQVSTMRVLISRLKIEFDITEVVGHRDLPGVKKACPCFDAKTEYQNA